MPALRVIVVVSTDRASPVRRFVVGSALVHIGFVLVALLAPRLFGAQRVPDDFPIVRLVGGIPGPTRAAPPTPPQPTPPQPEPTPEGAHAAQDKPVAVDVKPKKTKKPEKKDLPKPAATSPPTHPPVKPQTEQTTEPAAGSPGDGGEVLSTLGGDAEFAWYRASVTAALYGNWHAPPLAGLRDSVEVSIAFDIHRSGAVRNVRIEASSGIRSLDRSALRAVADASPLPALPAAWHESIMTAGFVFRLFPDDF